tara:strand:+ start:46 stop:801 length:756 start_codon:yes stop_codon:yes gene_type:complete
MAEETRQFPTEVIDLPSKGYFYPSESPLSSGQVEIKYMTAREEDILTSVNLIQKGLAIDKLLESLIVNKDINAKDILIGDKNAIMIASRVLGYGKEYVVDVDGEEVSIDLTTLKDKEIDFSKSEKGKNEFSYTLPNSKRNITFKILSWSDDESIDKELEALEKVGSEVKSEMTTRLKRRITSVDGNTEQSYINNFVDNEFLSVDSLAFRQYADDITPDVDMNYKFISSVDGEEKEIVVPMTTQFFWPSARK